MNCPHCGIELEYADVTICPKCRESLISEETETKQDIIEMPQKQVDLLFAAAILTMISAIFIASLGCLGVYQYFASIDYYLTYYGYSVASEVVGFLIFGVDGIIAAAFGLLGALFMLKRKWFRFSMLGTIFPLASVFVILLCILQYGYGFTDVLVFTEVATAMFSSISILMNFASRKQYM